MAKFYKTLAKYYYGWLQDCYKSADYCNAHGNTERANEYLANAAYYQEIINNHKDAIEYFAVSDRAFLIDSAILPQFRGMD